MALPDGNAHAAALAAPPARREDGHEAAARLVVLEEPIELRAEDGGHRGPILGGARHGGHHLADFRASWGFLWAW